MPVSYHLLSNKKQKPKKQEKHSVGIDGWVGNISVCGSLSSSPRLKRRAGSDFRIDSTRTVLIGITEYMLKM